MLPKFNTARAYLSFDEIAQVIEHYLPSRIRPVFGYSAEQIVARVVQRFVEISLAPFVQECAKKVKIGEKPISLADQPVEFFGFSISSEKISMSNKVLLKALADFFIHALHVLAVMIIYTFKPSNKKLESCTLVFGVGIESITRNGSDAEFIQFCKKSEIKPLNTANSIIVQSAQSINTTLPNYASYSRFPLMLLISNNPPSFMQLGSFLIEHTKATITYFKKIYDCSLVSLIGRDFAYHAMIKFLNQKHLIENVVITNSNYSSQPLWMRCFEGCNFNTHMVWYSQNTIPFTYINDPISIPLPNNRHIYADESWVWTKGYADYLLAIGIKSKTNVVGPIVWYLPNLKPASKVGDEFKITIFDVTPVVENFAEELGIFYNYYSTENCMRFVQDIVTTCEAIKKETNVNIKLVLKHKREHHALHDKNYIKLIDQLSNQSQIYLAESEADIFDLVTSSQLVIVIPYSSPVSIANYLKVPSIYFDATQELLPTYENAKNSYFASDKDELNNLIVKVINESKQKLAGYYDSRETI